MKDSLMKLSVNQTNPGAAKASDFPVKVPAQGMEPGKDKLMDGVTDRREVKEESFTVGQSSSEEGTSVKCNWGVDLNDGQVTPNVEDSY